jgi:hypothetical protein
MPGNLHGEGEVQVKGRALPEKLRGGTLVARTPGIKFLRIVMIATLCVGALMIVTFVIEACKGTLNPDDVRRFVPKAAFAVVLAGYIFHKTRNNPPS